MRESWRIPDRKLSQPADRPGDATPDGERGESPADREFRIAGEVLKFLEYAKAHPDEANEKFNEIDPALSRDDRTEFRRRLVFAGYTIDQGEEEGHPETSPTEPMELLPLKTLKDFEREFGPLEEDHMVDGIPFWILPDGDAALPGPRGQGGQRIGKNGYVRGVKGNWYQFDGEKFNRAPDDKRPARERKNEGPPEVRNADAAPLNPTPPKIGDRPKEVSAVERASQSFDREYNPDRRDSLAISYAKAVDGLGREARADFDAKFRERFKEVPKGILDAIMSLADKKEEVIERRTRS